MDKEEFEDTLLEKCSEAVHKAYCNYFLKNKGKEYWTKGDYSLLDEPTKQIDRETVKAVFNIVWQWMEEYTEQVRVNVFRTIAINHFVLTEDGFENYIESVIEELGK